MKQKHPIPPTLAARPVDSRGYPVPAGVWQNPETGEYDFRILDQKKRLLALNSKSCGVSGLPLRWGEYWFIGGPATFKSRLFTDPPMLKEVAEYSLQTCPHLALLSSQYRQSGMEQHAKAEKMSLEKQDLFMLGMTSSYEIETIDDFIYVRAGPWKVVGFWREGVALKRDVARELLKEHDIHL